MGAEVGRKVYGEWIWRPAQTRDPNLCNPRDLLHQIPLGLYGEYIVNSTVHKLIFADSWVIHSFGKATVHL